MLSPPIACFFVYIICTLTKQAHQFLRHTASDYLGGRIFLSVCQNHEPSRHHKMGKILFGITVALASLMLVESLTCNQCNYGLAGYCLSNTEVACSNSTHVCFSAKATFPAVSDTNGFNTLGCRETSGCNVTGSGTLLGITYETQLNCCETDKCNTVQLSGAPSTKMTLTATIAAAILASMCGSLL